MNTRERISLVKHEMPHNIPANTEVKGWVTGHTLSIERQLGQPANRRISLTYNHGDGPALVRAISESEIEFDF